jgi:predicted alpha/beta hydrolase family esterase
MVQWLGWRCAMAPVTAREQLRVAHALGELPALTEAFAAGVLSYSQVRAITRVASPATDRALVDFARLMTAAQLERAVSAYRGLRAVSTETARDRYRRRSFVSFIDDEGMRVAIVRQAPEDGAALAAAGVLRGGRSSYRP